MFLLRVVQLLVSKSWQRLHLTNRMSDCQQRLMLQRNVHMWNKHKTAEYLKIHSWDQSDWKTSGIKKEKMELNSFSQTHWMISVFFKVWWVFLRHTQNYLPAVCLLKTQATGSNCFLTTKNRKQWTFEWELRMKQKQNKFKKKKTLVTSRSLSEASETTRTQKWIFIPSEWSSRTRGS